MLPIQNTASEMHGCYVISNEKGLTYNGYTVNYERRLRQHNCVLKGGARYTRNRGPWTYVFQIESEHLTKQKALSLEWSFRYPTNKRPRPREYSSPEGRIRSIQLVLENPKFADIPHFTIRVCSEYLELVKSLLSEITRIDIYPIE